MSVAGRRPLKIYFNPVLQVCLEASLKLLLSIITIDIKYIFKYDEETC